MVAVAVLAGCLPEHIRLLLELHIPLLSAQVVMVGQVEHQTLGQRGLILFLVRLPPLEVELQTSTLLAVTVVLAVVQDTQPLLLVVQQLAVKETTVVMGEVLGSVLVAVVVLVVLVKTVKQVMHLRLVEMV